MPRASIDQMVKELLGNNIRQLRIERGWSTPQLARKLSVSYQQVLKYESGVNAFNSTLVPLICMEFAITPNDLYSWDQLPLIEPKDKKYNLQDIMDAIHRTHQK